MCVNALRAYKGDTLFYVGEWEGRSGLLAMMSPRTQCGLTAGRTFQDEIRAAWKLVETVPLPRWPGFCDRLYIFRRVAAADSGVETVAEPPPPPPEAAAGTSASAALGTRLATLRSLGGSSAGRQQAVMAAALLHAELECS